MGSRYEAYTFLEQSEDVDIYDPFSVNWSTFEFPAGTVRESFLAEDLEHPDNVGIRNGVPSIYWDVLLLINGIEDPFEIQVGQAVLVPPLDSIVDFIGRYQKR